MEHPEFHCSTGGRGRLNQEEKKAEGKSRAGWGESAHNFNAAIDLFINGDGHELYDRDWFDAVLAPVVPGWMNWYGAPGSKFQEIPHIEIKMWRLLRDKGMLHLVERDDDQA